MANETRAGAVSLRADLLAFDPKDSYGIAAGNDPLQVAQPGATRTYTYFASPEIGETTALLMDGGSPLLSPRVGLYGAIIVGPRGAKYRDPTSGADISLKASWRADVLPASGSAYRDFALFMQDEDEVIGTAIMPYSEHVEGIVGLNYLAERLDARLAKNDDPSRVFRSDVHGDPSTPLLEAFAGDHVKVHVLVPYSEQAHVFTLENHQWPLEPGHSGSDQRRSQQVGAFEAITIALESAGGRARLPGDYLYGDHREPFREVGLWGLFRVYARNAPNVKLKTLP
ncbi:MAG: hypothetical protein LC737_00060 [Chloroflexi bacterium]|nr:hypothetical protein [Chloroflexota bacterium]